MMRPDPDLRIEHRFWRGGFTRVAGLDEAGRGALAGPIAVGAVILPATRPAALGGRRGSWRPKLRGVRDSKQMTPAQRALAAVSIREQAVACCVGFASSAEIDDFGIVAAGRLAALRALEGLGLYPQALLTDFRLELPELDIPQTSLVRGDVWCMSIAAASVLAKTARDALMGELDQEFGGYGLARHKGYGTLQHRLAIRRIGPSPIHRQTFSMGI